MKVVDLLNLLNRVPGDTDFKDINFEVDGSPVTADSILKQLTPAAAPTP